MWAPPTHTSTAPLTPDIPYLLPVSLSSIPLPCPAQITAHSPANSLIPRHIKPAGFIIRTMITAGSCDITTKVAGLYMYMFCSM